MPHATISAARVSRMILSVSINWKAALHHADGHRHGEVLHFAAPLPFSQNRGLYNLFQWPLPICHSKAPVRAV